MNNMGYKEPTVGQTPIPAALRDDSYGNIAKRPTICDVYGLVDAAYRQ
jgi:hypothetical protein